MAPQSAEKERGEKEACECMGHGIPGACSGGEREREEDYFVFFLHCLSCPSFSLTCSSLLYQLHVSFSSSFFSRPKCHCHLSPGRHRPGHRPGQALSSHCGATVLFQEGGYKMIYEEEEGR